MERGFMLKAIGRWKETRWGIEQALSKARSKARGKARGKY